MKEGLVHEYIHRKGYFLYLGNEEILIKTKSNFSFPILEIREIFLST